MHRSAPQVEQFYIMCITLQGQQDSVDHKYLKPRLKKVVMCRLSRVKCQQKFKNFCTAPGEPYLKKLKNSSDAEFHAERDPVICNLKFSSGLDILAEHRTVCTAPNSTN